MARLSNNAEEAFQLYMKLKKLKLAENSCIPLYYQLCRVLQGFIREQRLKQGDRFPPEEVIAACLGVSRPTVNKAVQELVRQGWLVRDRGRGTFVHREPLVDLTLLSENLSLTEQFPPDTPPQTEFIRRMIYPAREVPDVMEILGLGPETEILYIRRLRYAHGRPVMVCDAYLEAGRFPALKERPFVRDSLYATLEEVYGVIIDRSERRVEAAEIVEPEVADLLGTQLFSPVLLLTGLTFIRGEEKPIEYMVSYVKEGVTFKSTVRRKGIDQSSLVERTGLKPLRSECPPHLPDEKAYISLPHVSEGFPGAYLERNKGKL